MKSRAYPPFYKQPHNFYKKILIPPYIFFKNLIPL